MANYTIKPVIVGPLETNCWLYPLADQADPAFDGRRPCAVIDPGDDPERIIEQMEALSLYPRYFLLTHGHFDHISALAVLAARYAGPAAPEIAIHREDADCLGPEEDRVRRSAPGGAVEANRLLDFEADLPLPGILLSGNERIGPFTVLHLPGHSPGSVAFYDPAAGVLFSGDTLFRDDVGRADLPGGNNVRLEESLRRLFALDGGTMTCPGHGPVTTIGEERRRYSSL
jgi:glyoxylase-like metal-dependent hydrolase (beta-lactamase superfamily II)